MSDKIDGIFYDFVRFLASPSKLSFPRCWLNTFWGKDSVEGSNQSNSIACLNHHTSNVVITVRGALTRT